MSLGVWTELLLFQGWLVSGSEFWTKCCCVKVGNTEWSGFGRKCVFKLVTVSDQSLEGGGVWKKVCCFRVGDHGLKESVVSNLGTVSVPGFEIAVFRSWTQ